MTYSETYEYESVCATPELVGREKILRQIEEAIHDQSNSYIIYVRGKGGIGKTRLLAHILSQEYHKGSFVVASSPIDFYHTRVHSLSGFIGALLRVVKGLDEYLMGSATHDAGSEYLRELDDLAHAEQEGFSRAEVLSRSENLTKIIGDYFSDKRFILTLDTTEKLIVEGPIVDLSAEGSNGDLPPENPMIQDWILEHLLPGLENVVLIMAGRPKSGQLAGKLDLKLDEFCDTHANRVKTTIDLPGLNERETLDYFDAVTTVAQASDTSHGRRTVKVLRSLDQERRHVIFHCLRDGEDPPTIPPIWLALSIDHLVIAGRPLKAFSSDLADARHYSAHQRQEIRGELGKRLVQALRDERRPGDKAIIALGWLRKGGPPALVARVGDLALEEVEDALEQIRDLSFVKRRPEDNRLFLHDEMYNLLFRHDLGVGDIMDPERERVHQAIRRYYKQRIKDARQTIADFYPSSDNELPDPSQVTEARIHFEDALVEDLHYHLRWNSAAGFQTYFLYAEEAIATHDEHLDMQLRAEILTFVAEQDPSGKQEIIADGLRRADLEADAAIRWVKRYVEQQNLDEAWRTVQALHNGKHDLIAAGGVLAEAERDTWEALVCIYRGDIGQAEPLLLTANDRLRELMVIEEISAAQSIRWSAILARNYNNLGYLRRVQGQFIAAAKAYQDALPHWRLTKLEAEQANTLTNLAYVLALSGRFEEARQRLEDALNLRMKLGTRVPLVLTYNTRAAVEVHAGQYHAAEPHAEKALQISQNLNFDRGVGLSLLTLSRLHRFMSEHPGTPSKNKLRLLKQSLEEAKKALKHFTEDEEPERRLEGFYEQGLTHRQLTLIDADEALEHGELAICNLEEARDIARSEHLWQKYMDASLGLAWTYYYLQREQPERTVEIEEWEDPESFLEALDKEIKEKFGSYLITRYGKPEIEASDAVIIDVFSQLGRLHVLRGVIAMDRFEVRTEGPPPYTHLRTAISEFVLALEYSEQVGEEYQGIRRGLHTIHDRLKGLNVDEVLVAFETIRETAKDYEPIAERNRLWHELENAFGSYEQYKLLTSKQERGTFLL